MKRIKKFFQIGGTEMLDKLPDGHTMSMGYRSETFVSESEILGVLMAESGKATTDAERALIDRIGASLDVYWQSDN